MTREEMRAAIRPLMHEERYRHSLAVEREAERLARRYGEDPEKAAIAGILHDCCKEMPLPEALQIVGQSAIIPDIDFREHSVNREFVAVFAKSARDIVLVVAGLIFLSEHGYVVISTVNCGAHKVCRARVKSDVFLINVLFADCLCH